jgi:transposase-like protein
MMELEVRRMKKGQKKRIWTPEQKAKIVHKHLDEHVSVRTLEKEYTADRGMICRWVKEYLAGGEQAFIPKGHPGNPFAALHTSKKLSELDRLRLTVAKLEIENARLKKGYWVEGAGANKVYVTGSETITKSSKNSE